MDLYSLYRVPHMIPWGNYNFPRNTNKIQLFDEISTSGKKNVDLMKDLKYEHQSIFPLWGMVKLNFRDRYGKPNIYSKNSSHYQEFLSNSQKMTLWCKKKSLPTQMDLYRSYMLYYMLPWVNYIFLRSTNKIPFLNEISTSGKNC